MEEKEGEEDVVVVVVEAFGGKGKCVSVTSKVDGLSVRVAIDAGAEEQPTEGGDESKDGDIG